MPGPPPTPVATPTRRSRVIAAAGLVALAALVTACAASGGTVEAERTLPSAVGRRSTTMPSPPTTEPPTTTTTMAVPPAVAVDGDPGSGNLSAEPFTWLDVVVDGSSVPNRLVATNHSAMPVDVGLDLAVAANVWSEPALPARVVVPPLSTQVVASIGPLDRSGAWSFEFTYRYEFGPPGAVAAPATYAFPVPTGVRAPIVQGPGGSFSHTDGVSAYAYDLGVPIGTPVLAMRPGVVGTIDQGFTEAGTDPSFLQRGNAIRVLHDDGTLGIYLHLDPRSSRVRIGDAVEAGQVLALSGNTGFSGGPHLHVALLANQDSQATSLPFELAER